VDRIFGQPAHPYTRALMLAIPSTNPRQRRETVPLQGETPSPTATPPGCVFSSRCPHATDACRVAIPALEAISAADDPARRHVVACVRRDEIGAWPQRAAVAA
jgi:oligopeptide/dipeptide ABC transporter ATP-binding protein